MSSEFDKIPHLTREAKSALDTYMDKAGEAAARDIPQRTKRIMGTLATYAPEAMSRHAYDVAALQRLANHIHDKNHPVRYEAAGLGLLDYFSQPSSIDDSKALNYAGILFGDMKHLDEHSDWYENRLRGSAEWFRGDDEDGDSRERWLDLRVGPIVPVLARAALHNNVESIISKAAFTLDHVAAPSDDDRKLFRDINRLETFYAPILEAWGLHAFHMSATSNANQQRILRSGHEDALEKSAAILDVATSIETEDVLKLFFGVKPDSHIFHVADDSIYDEKIIYSTTGMDQFGYESGELKSRFKTLGKYAMKALSHDYYSFDNPKQRPPDVFGILAVMDDEAQLADVFTRVIERVDLSDDVELVVPPSKPQPLYIQGSDDFKHKVCERLPENVHSRLKISPERGNADEVYQVIKFYARAKFGKFELPIEFQFQTKADRENARLGTRSHMNHDSGIGISSVVPGSKKDLRDIYDRRAKVDATGETVNERSIKHGAEFHRALYESLDY